MSKCRGCGADIEWIVMDTGKKMPVDQKPLKMIMKTPKGGKMITAFTSHWATCPQAGQFKKKKPKAIKEGTVQKGGRNTAPTVSRPNTKPQPMPTRFLKAPLGKCTSCDTELGIKGGMGGTDLCGPCCTGESETIDERGETW